MSKDEFLRSLKRALRDVQRDERDRSLAYYREMILDRMEEGQTEEAVIAAMEPVDVIAAKLRADAAEQGKLKKKREPWMIVLLVLGFPIWFSLLAAAAVVLIALYLVLWALDIVLFALIIALLCLGVTIFMGMALLFTPYSLLGLLLVGCALCAVGLGLLLLWPAIQFARVLVKGVQKFFMALAKRRVR